MVREVTMRLASSVPWDIMQDIYDRAIMKGAARRIGQKVREARLADTSNTSEDEYGSGADDDTGAY